MAFLAIETSTPRGSLAVLARGASCVAEASFPEGLVHAREIGSRLRDLLGTVGLEPRDLEGISVSVGPGSFTGLRVGVTAAKTLAFALRIPVVSESSLAVLASNGLRSSEAPAGAVLVPVTVGGRTAFHGAGFLGPWGAREVPARPQAPPLVRVVADGVYSAEDLARTLGEAWGGGGAVLVFGDGADAFLDVVQGVPGVTGASVVRGPATWDAPRASVLGWLCAARLEAARFEAEELHRLEPWYGRPSYAEVRRAPR